MWDADDGFFYDQLSRPDGPRTRSGSRSIVGRDPGPGRGLHRRPTRPWHATRDSASTVRELPGRRGWTRVDSGRAGFIHRAARGAPAAAHDRRPGAAAPRARRGARARTRCCRPRPALAVQAPRRATRSRIDRRRAGRRVDYEPAESHTPIYGGNSNWRGPVWFPLNHSSSRRSSATTCTSATTSRWSARPAGVLTNLQEVADELRRA